MAISAEIALHFMHEDCVILYVEQEKIIMRLGPYSGSHSMQPTNAGIAGK